MRNSLKLIILVGILSFVSACSSDDTTLSQQNRDLLEGSWVLFAWSEEMEPGKMGISGVQYDDNMTLNSVTFRKDGTAVYQASTYGEQQEDISTFEYNVVVDIIHYPTRLSSEASINPLSAGKYQEIISVDKNFLVLKMLQFREVYLRFYREK